MFLYQSLLFISMTEIVFILFIAFLLFGTKKMPEIARGLGKGYREFQKATDEIKNEFNKVASDIKTEVENSDNKKRNDDSRIKEDLNNHQESADRAG